jgi:hypothetical protein
MNYWRGHMTAPKMSEREAYKTAEMTSWYYYLALKSEVLCLCHYKLSKACYVSQIVYNPSKLSPAYAGAIFFFFLRFSTKIHRKQGSRQNVWYESPKKCHLVTTEFGGGCSTKPLSEYSGVLLLRTRVAHVMPTIWQFFCSLRGHGTRDTK